MCKTYLVYDGRYYKIGRSKDPDRRLRDLRVGNPKVKMIAYGKGISEKALHKLYEKKKIKGEWFDLCKRELKEVIFLLENEYRFCKIDGGRAKIKSRERDAAEWEKYSKIVISFGKYKNMRLIDMNKDEEIRYLKWCADNFTYEHPQLGAFRWWIKEHKLANILSNV